MDRQRKIDLLIALDHTDLEILEIVRSEGLDMKTSTGDKAPWNARVSKGQQDFLDLQEIAKNPEDYHDIIAEQEDPIGYLSHAFEVEGITRFGLEHESGLPISHDGSCNAYQHNSAYLMDAQTGDCVNMIPLSKDDAPNDMYGRVGNNMKKRLQTEENEIGDKFLEIDGVGRKDTKRITMCQGYGLTENGAINYARENIKKDHTKVVDGEVLCVFDQFDTEKTTGAELAATFFAKEVLNSVDLVAPAVQNAKKAIQLLVEIRATEKNKEFNVRAQEIIDTGMQTSFISGLGAVATYRKTEVKDVRTRIPNRGKYIQTVIKRDTGKVSARGMSNASSPNFTHMKDAEHEQRHLIAMSGENFLMIHDSFGCGVGHSQEQYETIRRTFIEQYSTSRPLDELFKYTMEEVHERHQENMDKYFLETIDHCMDVELLQMALDDMKPHKKNWTDEDKKFNKLITKMKKVRELSVRKNDLDLSKIMDCPYFFL